LAAQRAVLRAPCGGRGVGGSSSQQVVVQGPHVVTSGLATPQLDETQVRMAAGSKEKKTKVIDLTANSDAEGDEGASSASAASKKGPPRKHVKVKSEEQR